MFPAASARLAFEAAFPSFSELDGDDGDLIWFIDSSQQQDCENGFHA